MRNPHSFKKSKSSFDSLPTDILIKVFIKCAEASSNPPNGIASLQKTCKTFYVASKPRTIFKDIMVRKKLSLIWWHKEKFFSWIQYCAFVGNLDAYYILGLEEIYNLGKEKQGLVYLSRAMFGGHNLATYTLAMIKFHHKRTREIGVELLNKLEKSVGPQGVLALREEAASTIQKITFNKWEANPDMYIDHHGMCGKPARKEGTTDWFEEEAHKFCSERCRWNHEYSKFFQMIWPMPIHGIIN